MTTEAPVVTIGRLLQDRRGDGYETEAARAIGVSRQIYDQWEDDYTIPGSKWVVPLSEYLGISEADIVLILYHSWHLKNRDEESPVAGHNVEGGHPAWDDSPIGESDFWGRLAKAS